MAVDFLQRHNSVAAYLQTAWHTSTPKDIAWSSDQSVSILHICTWLSLTSIISALGHGTIDVDIREPIDHKTPLIYACKRDHLDITHQLLTLGASVNASSFGGTTSIFEAIAGNHTDIIKPPSSERELQINTEDLGQYKRTALMTAVSSQLFSTVQDLSQTPVLDINKQDVNSSTALSIAVTQDDPSIIRLLLD